MGHQLRLSLCLALLSGCALFRPPARPAKAPPEQAARFTFPIVLPAEGQQVLPGPLAAAMALAMEDFLPLGSKPPKNASPSEVCAHQRDSYDVTAVPGEEDIVFVSFSRREESCRDLQGPPIADVPIIYAVDVRRWLILSVQK